MDQRTDAREHKARPLSLGSAIRRHRSEISQAELATRLGVSQSAVSQWETGIVHITCQQVAQVEGALRLRAGTLLIEAGYIDESLLGIEASRRYAIWKLDEAIAFLKE